MAIRNTLTHTKTLKLAKLLGIDPPFALGLLESFWQHVVASEFKDGDVSEIMEWPDLLQEKMHYRGDCKAFLDAMISVKYLDQMDGRTIVHDWSTWADDTVQSSLYRNLIPFADGTVPKGRKCSAKEADLLHRKWVAKYPHLFESHSNLSSPLAPAEIKKGAALDARADSSRPVGEPSVSERVPAGCVAAPYQSQGPEPEPEPVPETRNQKPEPVSIQREKEEHSYFWWNLEPVDDTGRFAATLAKGLAAAKLTGGKNLVLSNEILEGDLRRVAAECLAFLPKTMSGASPDWSVLDTKMVDFHQWVARHKMLWCDVRVADGMLAYLTNARKAWLDLERSAASLRANAASAPKSEVEVLPRLADMMIDELLDVFRDEKTEAELRAICENFAAKYKPDPGQAQTLRITVGNVPDRVGHNPSVFTQSINSQVYGAMSEKQRDKWRKYQYQRQLSEFMAEEKVHADRANERAKIIEERRQRQSG